MERGESVLYFFFMAGSTAFAYSAIKHLSLGTAEVPGPGYVPLLVSIIAFVLSTVLFVQALRKAAKNKTQSIIASVKNAWMDIEIRKKVLRVACFVALTVVYLLLFDKISFYISTFVYMTLLGKLFGMKGWWRPLLLGAGFVVGIYLIFVVAFDMHI